MVAWVRGNSHVRKSTPQHCPWQGSGAKAFEIRGARAADNRPPCLRRKLTRRRDMLSIIMVSRFVLLYLVPACLTMAVCPCLVQGQQTGAAGAPAGTTAGRTAGTARQNAGLIAIRVKPAEPACTAEIAASSASSEPSSLPEIAFSRGSALVCVRHADGRTEELKGRYSEGNFSRDGKEAAYWLPEKGELHVVSIATGSDELV